MELDQAPALLPQLAGVTTSTSDQSPAIVGKVLVLSRPLSTVSMDVYANRPLAPAVQGGSLFYASDQVALYLTDGVNWFRIGPSMPGDIIWTNETTARTGYVLLQGQAWPSTTGIYSDLFALWGGATLPDVQGRTMAAIGTNADVNALLKNEGVATVANRRQKHQTTDAKTVAKGTLAASDSGHTHSDSGHGHSDAGHNHNVNQPTPDNRVTLTGAGNFFAVGGGSLGTTVGIANIQTGFANISTGNANITVTGAPTLGGTIGTGVATDPTDTGAYLVLQPQAKL